jgi:SNF2 family DNA or RNA helicase
VAQGTPSKIKTALDPGGDIYVLSWDSLRRYSKLSGYGSIKLSDDEKASKEIQDIAPVSVILDEIHRAKNPKAQTTRAAWATTKTATNVIGLTGTPIQESCDDLWSVLFAITPDEYPTRTSYRERYLETKFNQWGQLEIGGVRENRQVEFFANLDARMRRLTKKAALPHLPDKLYETRWVTLPPKMRKAYSEMEAVLIAELETSTLTAASAMERAMRCLQLANSSGTVTEEAQPDGTVKLKFHMELPSPKVDAFLDDVKDGDFGDSSVVIFSDSRQLADLLSLEMKRKGLAHLMITGGVTGEDRTKAIDAFQAGDVKYIIITRAGSEGITLTRADVLVRLIRSWSLTVHTQGEDRVHRIGSEVHESIKIVDYLTEDTIEVEQVIRLNGKDARAQEVLRDDELLTMLKARLDARE